MVQSFPTLKLYLHIGGLVFSMYYFFQFQHNPPDIVSTFQKKQWLMETIGKSSPLMYLEWYLEENSHLQVVFCRNGIIIYHQLFLLASHYRFKYKDQTKLKIFLVLKIKLAKLLWKNYKNCKMLLPNCHSSLLPLINKLNTCFLSLFSHCFCCSIKTILYL